MDLSKLEPGQLLMERRVAVTAERAAAYAAATGDGCALYAEEGVVPPMAVAALALAEAMAAVSLPAGAVHTGQEFAFLRPVPANAEANVTASVAVNGVRRGTRIFALDLRADLDGEPALEGRTSLAIPEGDE